MRPDRRLSIAQRGALVLIRGYKLVFSPYFAGSCRYLPSCSEYAAEAIATHGVARGSWLALRRLSRCHPLGSSGFDPPPPAVTALGRAQRQVPAPNVRPHC